MRPRKLRRPDYVLPRRLGVAVGDIVVNRAGEQIYILLNDSDILAQALERDTL